MLRRLFGAALALLLSFAVAQAAAPFDDSYVVPPNWTKPFAKVDLNFAAGQYWPANALSKITTSRASIRTCPDAAGNYYQVGNNQPCITNLGLWVEEARTNLVRNNTMQGVVTGSPGTLPTNWVQSTSVAGITRTIVGTGVENGIPYVDIQYAGTPTASGQQNLAFETQGVIPASYGQTFTESVFIRVSAGSTTNIALLAVQVAYYSSSMFVANGVFNVNTTAVPNLGAARNQVSGSSTSSSTVTVNPLLTMNLTSGQAINVTFRIGWPQLEQDSLINSTLYSATVNASGSGGVNGTAVYSVTGGTCSTAPTLNVVWTSGTLSITSIANAGSCTVFPPSPATLAYVSGVASGWTNASVNLTPTNLAADGFATTPIPTSGSAVTRAADFVSMQLPAGSTSGVSASLLGIGTPEAANGYIQGQGLAAISDGTVNNLLVIYRAIGLYEIFQGLSGVQTFAPQSGNWNQFTQGKLAILSTPSQVTGVVNNGTPVTNSVSGIPPVSTMQIGMTQISGNVQFDGAISRVIVSPRSLLND